MNREIIILALSISVFGGQAQADNRQQLDKTTILGNRELPKVTFVMPWRDEPIAIPSWQPGLTSRPLELPLDDKQYQRQVLYLRQLNYPNKGVQTQ